ncbi:MAG: peptide chain release factor N(5)-glutamine methyltransferase, partial [Phycisphaerae bacterium]|nr:peptide chain release factor N(5)-glutamine methyltransferase [Phycisphaerae bacterium]
MVYIGGMEVWTIQKLLGWMVEYFGVKGVDSPRFSAELLLAHVLGWKRIELYTHFNAAVGAQRLAELRGLVKRAGEHEPIAYLVGATEFYSMTIRVSRDCLIPRPETEGLVERAIDFLRRRSGEQQVLDLCTGSGCIAVAIAKNHPTANVMATDICEKALSVAAENMRAHGLEDRVRLLAGDLFEPVIAGLDAARFDLIVSNPPYVSASEYEKLDRNVRDYEPKKALDGGADGLDVYRRIAARAAEF